MLQKLGILDQVEVNSALIELFVEANKLQLKEWQKSLEETFERKTIIVQDIENYLDQLA